MKRKLVAIVAVLLLLVHVAPEVSHADELTGLTLEKEMRAMIELEVIKGYGGKVYPKADVSRGDFAAFLADQTAVIGAKVQPGRHPSVINRGPR